LRRNEKAAAIDAVDGFKAPATGNRTSARMGGEMTQICRLLSCSVEPLRRRARPLPSA